MSKVKIEKREFIPKPKLCLQEFLAIKSFYSGADFERNSIVPMTVPLVGGLLWFTQRMLKRMKMFL